VKGKIRTVLGDINPKENGITDTHDHLIRTGGIEVR
jgi:predicted metal-dependent phosphotriesterase family hydrolase